MKEQIRRGLEELKIPYSEETALEQMAAFVEELLIKNQVMNLTAITEPEEVVARHLLDSAYLTHHIPEGTETLIDVGTGAGFPGMPLKILRPELNVTLMDALEKRLRWLEEVGEQLGLSQLETLHGRGEDLPHEPDHRERYQIATARAVAELRILVELTLPFVAVGGRFLAMKSQECDEELNDAEKAIEVLGGRILEVVDYGIPEKDYTYRLIVIEKIATTPSIYPRRWKKMKSTKIS